MTAGGNSFKNATAHKVNSYYTLAISYRTFCVGKHTILGPEISPSSFLSMVFLLSFLQLGCQWKILLAGEPDFFQSKHTSKVI